MPTDLEMLMGGNVNGRAVIDVGSAEGTTPGRMVQDRNYLSELLNVHKYRGKNNDVVMLDMADLEERVMAHMLDQIPVMQKKVRRPKREMLLRNHEINHQALGKSVMTRTYLKRVVIRDENGLFVADGDTLIEALREVKLKNLLKQMIVLDQDEGHRWMFQFSHVNNHIVLTAQTPDCCDGTIRMGDLL